MCYLCVKTTTNLIQEMIVVACKRAMCIIMAITLLCTSVYAQHKKNKKKETTEEKIPVFNVVIDDPMDTYGRQPMPEITNKVTLLPEFCTYGGQIKDTIRRYEFYNTAHQLINADTLKNYKELHFVSLLEGYTDHEHTYRDAAGNLQPLPVSKIVSRYDRTADDRWLHVNYKTNKTIQLQEHVTDIVRTDTIHSTDGSMIVRQYYKVTIVQ